VATTLSDPLTGRLLDGRYEVGRLVARGGMATVYEAVDIRLERTVAIKVMHPALAADAEFVARFIREARSAARLSHPNVVAVYDQGSDGDAVYLAMEYVDGATLRDLMRMRGRLAPADALVIFEQVLGALGAAHKAGLVHRDVKPENVLLTEDGRVKVADFGLARAISSTVASNTLTSGLIMGTVSYLSPEQVERSVADARSDVYAAGIVLFEMITGDKPYSGGTPMEVAFRHVHERVPAPSTIVSGVSRDLDTLVLRSTARDPDDRPRDANDLLVDVTRVRDGRPIFLQQLDDDAEPTIRHDADASGPRPGDTLVAPRPDLGSGRPSGPPTRAAPSDPSRAAGSPADVVGRVIAGQRRRRGWILLVLVLLLGAAAATGSWWYAEGRFTTMPTIAAGAARTDAITMLDQVGLDVRFAETFSEDVEPGAVVRTNPGPGARILTGARVTVEVSSGPERFTVPDVAGETPAGAAARLRDQPLGLGPAVEEYHPDVAAGLVIRTDPPADQRVPRDEEISLVVSKGPQPVDVPTVTGLTVEAALAELRDVGLVPIVDPEEFSDTVPAGSVIRQTHLDGRLFADDGVHIVPSKGPELFELPNVLDRTQDEAETILRDAGFEVDLVYPFGAAFIDRVLDQNPDGGTQLPRGTTITLQIV